MNGIFLAISQNADGYKQTIDITEAGLNIRNVILAVIVGFAIALIAMYYSKFIAGKTVRLMMEKGAFSEDKALSLSEMGITRAKGLHRHFLEKSYPHKNICKKLTSENGDDRYYIIESAKTRVERTYSSKENAVGLIAVTLVVLAAMFAAVYFWSDGIIERANRLINSITAPDRVETPADDTEDPDEDGEDGDSGEDGNSGEDLSGESTDTDGTASDEENVPSEDGEALN